MTGGFNVAEHVIVRFKDALGVPYQDGVWNRVSQIVGPRWEAITAEFGVLPIHRVFREVAPSPTYGQAGHVDDDRPEPYFDVQLPDIDTARRFIQKLRELRGDVIEEVYRRGQASLAKGTGAGGGGTRVPDSQGYFRQKPFGIDAVAAWNLHQAYGQSVTVADIELGWFLEHEMLPRDIPVAFGENASNKDHGVAVMGILVSDHARSEVKGGAPQAQTVAMSYARTMTEQLDRADVIRAAKRKLLPGDILLLEFGEEVDDDERGIHIVQAPAEGLPHMKGVIRECTEKGITVIEAAGNSGKNLDPLGLEVRHSGAVIVGSSFHDNGTHRWEAKALPSNYGSRVNCFAWGHDIRTLGQPPNGYQAFGGTSGAAAIIASAAALLQSVARRHFREIGHKRDYLVPEEMLTFLSDRDCGTWTEDHAHHPMGYMPSLGLVIEKFFKEYKGRGARPKLRIKGAKGTLAGIKGQTRPALAKVRKK